MEIVAVDLGYGYVKAMSSNGKQVLFPSIVGNGYERGLMNLFGDSSRDLSNIHVKVQGEDYFVGDLAKESRSQSRIFERERFNHGYTHILLNTAIQLVTDENTNAVKVVTGLPLDFYQSQAKDFQASITGVQPELEWQSGPVSGMRKVAIEQALVFPQGAAAIFAALMDDRGRPVYADLMREGSIIGLIDIGFRTTDFVVVEMKQGGSFVPKTKLSGTVDEGVINLYREIRQAYKTKTGGADLSESYVDRILRDRELTYRGEKMDFSQVIGRSLQAITANIVDRLKSVWAEESDLFDAIFLAGGGGTLFAEHFQPAFDHRLKTIPSSQFANAVGYARLGKAVFQSESSDSTTG
ncbi:ParM/StbA family protein [Lentibacillus salinarum]|uniref:Actin-like protein N-terminal domain-containing protein n=1 Tax=Lentibacillus salinarum TaxID=446820 RepID=A0ABW3ZXX7_9BACI